MVFFLGFALLLTVAHAPPLSACSRLWLDRADLEDRAGGMGTLLEVGVGLGLSLFLRITFQYEGLALTRVALSSGSFWDLVPSSPDVV